MTHVNEPEFDTGPHRPQLRILDLLAWMAGMGVIMAGYRYFNDVVSIERTPVEQNVEVARQVLSSAAYGACLAGAALLLFEWVSGSRLKLAPGHWLLWIEAAQTILLFVFWFWFVSDGWPPSRTEDWSRLGYLHVFWGAMDVAALIIFAQLAILIRETRRWTALFVGFSVLSVISAVFNGAQAWWWFHSLWGPSWDLHGLRVMLTLISTVWLAIVAVKDFRSPVVRDGRHWTGVGVLLALGILSIAHWVWWAMIVPLIRP